VVLYPSEGIREVLEVIGVPEGVELRRTGEVSAAAAVLTSSGTMSMHCALAGIPGAVVYRANPLTYLIGRWLVKVPYLGIANLLLKEAMYPEYIQGAATPTALARELTQCLESEARRERTQAQAELLKELLKTVGQSNVSDWVWREGLARFNDKVSR
jgi:lipid-A-disaccharide synthase